MHTYQVFISYKRDSEESIANRLYTELDTHGYRTFIDRVNLQDVTRFSDRIRSAILSSDAFIVLLSKRTVESEWVKKEVEIAIDGAKQGNKLIIPVITDDSSWQSFEVFLSHYVSDNFDFANEKQVITRLRVEGIYPSSSKRRAIIESTNQLKSIPEDISELIKKCNDCPHQSECSGNKFRHCQFSDNIDAVIRKSHFINKPLFQNDLYIIQNNIKTALNNLNQKQKNVLKLLGLDGYLEFINSQIDRRWRLKCEYLNILLKKEGFNSICKLLCSHFEKSRSAISSAISQGRHISENEYHSLLLLWWLIRGNSSIITKSLLLRETREAKQRLLKEINSFLDCYRQLVELPEDKAVFLKLAINFRSADWPEETENIGTKYLCGFLSNYSWLLYDETISTSVNDDDSITETTSYYLHESDEDPFHNPSWHACDLGLCRGIIEITNPFRKADYYETAIHLMNERDWEEKSNDGSLDSKSHSEIDIFDYSIKDFAYDVVENEFAANYLASLAYFCKDLDCFLRDDSKIPLIKTNTEINISKISKPHFMRFNDQGIRYIVNNVKDYEQVAFKQVDKEFKYALGDLGDRGVLSSSILKRIENASIRGDLSAQVYLANILLFKENNYKTAASLFETAALAGIELCFLRVAQCYEIIGDYKHALWWYMLLLEDPQHNQEEINLRIGNCCRHLGINSDKYFDCAGEKGQAAKYLTTSYYEWEEDENREQLRKALRSHLADASKRLGSFMDLHVWFEYDGKIIDEKEGVRKALEEKVKLETAETGSQYKLGLYELEDYVKNNEEFYKKALGRIRIAANSQDPDALCFMSVYLGRFKQDWQAEESFMKKAIKALFPSPFPDLSKIE